MPENLAQNHINETSCNFGVGQCPNCQFKEIIKYGFSKRGKQRFQCKVCKKTFITTYSNRYIKNSANKRIKVLLKEGCGIRSIGRILKISAVTVIRKIMIIAGELKLPDIRNGQFFQIDELHTFIGAKSNPKWIIYAINNEDKKVVTFNVGNRSNRDIGIVTNRLIATVPHTIYTDKLLQYRSLIAPDIHSTKRNSTNHIERKNLTLRTHLKRLGRKTICFSRSIAMLHACLMIYFFG